MIKVGPGTSPVEGGEVKDESKNGALSVKLDIAKVNALLEYSWIKSETTIIQTIFHTTTKTTAGFKDR